MFNRHLIIPLIACGIVALPALIYESDLWQSDETETVDPNRSEWAVPMAIPPSASQVALLPSQPRTTTTPVAPASSGHARYGFSADQLNSADALAWSRAYGTSVPSNGAATGFSGFDQQANSNRAGPIPWGTTAAPVTTAQPLAAEPVPTSGIAWTVPPVAQGVSFSSMSAVPVAAAVQPMTVPGVMSFQEILNWSITPDFVRNRFERVSVVETDYGLLGMRVPLVTGVNRYDLHGSLTYYFDENDRLQRISFRGWTGDVQALTDLLQNEFGLKPDNQASSRRYLSRQGRRIISAAVFKYAPVLEASRSTEQIAVGMEINNPSGGYILSQEFASSLSVAR